MNPPNDIGAQGKPDPASLASSTSEQTSNLREEIVASEKSRLSLLKYKLVATATLGGVGLGVGPENLKIAAFNPIHILCLIPFVCLYVDLLCWHNTLRILVIARYFRANGNPYEIYVHQLRGRIFGLEEWVLQWSTITLSALLLIYGLFNYVHLPDALDACVCLGQNGSSSWSRALIAVGFAGIVLSRIFKKQFDDRCKQLDSPQSPAI